MWGGEKQESNVDNNKRCFISNPKKYISYYKIID